MQNDDDEFVATLLHPDEYSHHMNQVAAVSTTNITFLKRKFASKAGYELIKHPLSECNQINYKEERSVVLAVFGVLLVLLIFFICYMLYVNWASLETGTHIKVGLLGLAVVYGVRWAFGSRRHKLEFILRNKTPLTWKSRAGDYKLKQAAVNRVIDFARSKGILRNS